MMQYSTTSSPPKTKSKEANKDFRASQRTHHTNKVLNLSGTRHSGTNGTAQDTIGPKQIRAEATAKIGGANHGAAAHQRKQMTETADEKPIGMV